MDLHERQKMGFCVREVASCGEGVKFVVQAIYIYIYRRQNLVVKSNYRWTMNTNQVRDNSKHMGYVYWRFLSRQKTTGLANFVKSI
jgi:hypothetical protein